jgi:hypothetical protein
MIHSASTWCIWVGWGFGGYVVIWGDQVLYRAAMLGILLLFHYLWMRAAIRRAADAKFAAVLGMAELHRQR